MKRAMLWFSVLWAIVVVNIVIALKDWSVLGPFIHYLLALVATLFGARILVAASSKRFSKNA
ncbi:MAG: hypothetical protein AAFY34_03725 [Pseudomonadota bacterium]